MKHTIFFLFVSMMIFSSCNPKLRAVIENERPALPYDSEVFVLAINEPSPSGAVSVGNLAIKDTGFTTKCTYEMVLEQARLKARENGANVVKIIEHKTPNVLGSNCHRLRVNFFYVADTATLEQQNKEPLIPNVDYALLHVYRHSGVGALIGYNLRLGDSTLCRVKNNFKQVIKIKKEGMNTLWTKTESKVEVPIDIEYGRSYYLRCGIKMGAVVGRPTMDLVDYRTGAMEFENLDAKNTGNGN